MTGRMAGQTINDRLLAAKHSLAGQGLAKSVCKATTEEMIGPKKKHLDFLVHCTNEPNVSIPQMANLLIERSQNNNWVVVYKALITVHHIMCYGNERFTQYLASSNCTFQLSNFFDKSGVQGALGARTGYDMSPFIRRYSRYLNEKALSYRTVAFDFCKVKRGKEDGMLRTMNAEKLLKTLPCLQSQLDALLEFDCSANDLTNGVINMCFMLLFRDLIRLFACYNDGIINLLEKYFDMNKKQCKDALDIYKKFLIRMDRVAEFLKVAENVGIDKGDIPDLTKAPSSLLEALEQHIVSLDGKKTSTSSTPSQSASSAFGTVVANGRLDSHPNGIDETLKKQALAEEEAAMNQFKSKVHSPTNTVNNPFLSSNASSTTVSSQSLPAMDFLGADAVSHPTSIRASDDLLQLGNPFVDMYAQPTQPAISPPTNVWLTNGNGYGNQPVITNGAFVSESSFSSIFGSAEPKTAEVPKCLSYNPFLVEDPVPSLLLDPDSPTDAKLQPLQNVIDYFQKEVSSLGSNNCTNKQNNSDENEGTNSKSIVNLIDTNKIANNVTEISLPLSDDFTKIESKSMQRQNSEANLNKTVPPPRPPPPRRASLGQESSVNKYLDGSFRLSNNTVNFDNNKYALNDCTDNNKSSMFVENEGLPVVTQSTAISSQVSGGVLQPSSPQGGQPSQPQKLTNNQQPTSALLTGDLESSLASLAENLSISSRPATVKGIQWNSPKNGSKSGASWTPQPLPATTSLGYKPMNQSMSNTQTSLPPQIYPQLQPMMGTRPLILPNAAILPQRTVMGTATSPGSTIPSMGVGTHRNKIPMRNLDNSSK